MNASTRALFGQNCTRKWQPSIWQDGKFNLRPFGYPAEAAGEKFTALLFLRHVEVDLIVIRRTGSVCKRVKDKGDDLG
jgi:hypothetical protein